MPIVNLLINKGLIKNQGENSLPLSAFIRPKGKPASARTSAIARPDKKLHLLFNQATRVRALLNRTRKKARKGAKKNHRPSIARETIAQQKNSVKNWQKKLAIAARKSARKDKNKMQTSKKIAQKKPATQRPAGKKRIFLGGKITY